MLVVCCNNHFIEIWCIHHFMQLKFICRPLRRIVQMLITSPTWMTKKHYNQMMMPSLVFILHVPVSLYSFWGELIIYAHLQSNRCAILPCGIAHNNNSNTSSQRQTMADAHSAIQQLSTEYFTQSCSSDCVGKKRSFIVSFAHARAHAHSTTAIRFVEASGAHIYSALRIYARFDLMSTETIGFLIRNWFNFICGLKKRNESRIYIYISRSDTNSP